MTTTHNPEVPQTPEAPRVREVIQTRSTSPVTVLADSWVIAKRNLIKIKRVPEILVFILISPIMFVLLFTYVYAGVIDIPGSTYTEFIMAGIFAQTVVFGSTYSGSAMAQDLKDGIIDRFRTMPINSTAVIGGHVVASLVRNLVATAVVIIAALVLGRSTGDAEN